MASAGRDYRRMCPRPDKVEYSKLLGNVVVSMKIDFANAVATYCDGTGLDRDLCRNVEREEERDKNVCGE